MNRLHNLDYLRGMAAFGIMIYHYLSWTLGKFSAETFMGRLGIYGVSIFYILSGLTLYYVYYNKMLPSKSDVFAFFKKRVFRIFPLLWLVTISAIIISQDVPNWYPLFLNLSGLFGFLDWNTFYSAGIWSIGNELVFYVFFPFFILFTKSYKPLMVVLSIVIFGLYLYFAFVQLDPSLGLSEQRTNYVNPLNQVFLFLSGYLIGIFFHNRHISNWTNVALLVLGVVLFMFYPAYGDQINIVTGMSRLVFTLSCLLVCLSFFKFNIKLPSIIHKPLTLLGEASYSVYLLHPIVYSLVGLAVVFANEHGLPLPQSVRLVLSIIFSLVISYFVYRYFEKYFMRMAASSHKK